MPAVNAIEVLDQNQLMPVEAEEIKVEVTGIATQTKQVIVTNPEQYQAAGEEVVRINSLIKRITDLFAEPKKKADQAHKSIVNTEKSLLDPLKTSKDAYGRAMLTFKQEQERLASEEQERQRKLAEEEARKRQEELEAQALEAIDNGNEEEAQELIDQTQTVIPIVPIVVPQVQKVAGIGTRKTWKAEVVDSSQVPAYWNGVEVRVINQSKLNEIARTFNGTAQIPGVKFYEEESISASKKAI